MYRLQKKITFSEKIVLYSSKYHDIVSMYAKFAGFKLKTLDLHKICLLLQFRLFYSKLVSNVLLWYIWHRSSLLLNYLTMGGI